MNNTATATRAEVKTRLNRDTGVRELVLSSEVRKEIAEEYMLDSFGFLVERCTIDPEEAQEILDNMALNRKIKSTGLSKYTSIMEKERWYLSPQGIIFDENNRLIDGQHRLEAVIRSGAPKDFIVYRGVSHEVPIDRGIARSNADSQRIRGILSPELARADNNSIVNALFSVTLTNNEKRAITEDDQAMFIDKYPDEVTFARLVSGKGDHHGIAAKAGVRGAILAAAICGVSRGAIEDLVVSINSMCFSPTSPARVVYKTLDQMRSNGQNSINYHEGIMEEAIFDYVNGRSRTQKYTGKTHPYSSKIPVRDILGIK